MGVPSELKPAMPDLMGCAESVLMALRPVTSSLSWATFALLTLMLAILQHNAMQQVTDVNTVLLAAS